MDEQAWRLRETDMEAMDEQTWRLRETGLEVKRNKLGGYGRTGLEAMDEWRKTGMKSVTDRCCE